MYVGHRMKTIIYLIVLLSGLFLLKSIFSPEPRYNWDALPYMAAVLKMDGVENPGQRFLQTYENAEKHIPSDKFFEMVNANHPYRHAMHVDSKGFAEQMPIYMVKPLYVFVSFLSYKWGANLFTATLIPSILSYYLVGLLFFFFIRVKLGNIWALVLTFLIAFLPSSQMVSAISSPDAMSTMLMIAGMMILFKRQNSIWASIIFALALLTRPDNVMFVFILYALLLIKSILEKQLIRQRLIELTLFLAAFFITTYISGNPGWKASFIHTFGGKQIYFISQARPFTWDIYFYTMDQLYRSFSNKILVYFLFASLFVFWDYGKSVNPFLFRFDFRQIVFITLGMTYLIRFLLFPDIHDRFYYVFFLILILVSIDKVSEMRHSYLES